jgi:NADPH:quinone reductase-like Zn-dependent oxidoreductase
VRAIQIDEFGGPEVLRLVELPDPEPTDGRVVCDVRAAGVNYADTHQVENSYLAEPQLPLVPGAEFVGVGPDGRRVVGLLFGGGGYAEKVAASPALTWPVPAGVSDSAALAVVLQGLTAWHLLRTSAHLAAGESVVVQAAAGGVGSIAVQLAKRWGAGRVIGVASTVDKQRLARELGADAVVDPAAEDLTAELVAANGGARVDVVLEMTGGPVFDASFAALAPFGRLCTYGLASRTPPSPVEPGALIARSRGVIGFWLAHCTRRPDMLRDQVTELLAMVADGTLRTVDGGSYPLADAGKAHEDIRSRRTVGKLALTP